MSNYTGNHVTEDTNHAWSKLLKIIPDNSCILDVGCSSGNLGAFLIKNKKCIVDGVEPDEKDAAIASKIMRNIWVMDIESAISKINKKYDVIVFADVLEHLMYPDKVLIMTKLLLKPKGRIVFSVPNMAHVSIRLALLAGGWEYTETGLLDKTHLHYWDINTVKEVFSKAGMSLKELDAVVYKYPKKLIRDKLEAIGLKAEDKGLDLLMSSEASTFQIVGYADISSLKHREVKLPDPALQKDISYLAADLVKQIENDRKHIKEAESYIKHLEKQIDDIKTSRTYKIAQKLSHYTNKPID